MQKETKTEEEMLKPVVLAATDFSTDSYEMLSKADALAMELGARFFIAHIVEESFFASVENLDEIRQNCLGFLNTHSPSLRFEDFFCKKGGVREEIAKLTIELDASIVVIGCEGDSSVIEDLFIGSHTKEIIRGSNAPVLISKRKQHPAYKKIVIPTDFSDESRITVKKVSEIFAGSKIVLLNIYSVPFESRLNSYYGFNDDAISQFQDTLRSDIQKKGEQFIKTLEVSSDRLELRIMRGSMNHKLFMGLIEPLEADLIALHTTGSFSFFAFDILESSTLDVLVYKF